MYSDKHFKKLILIMDFSIKQKSICIKLLKTHFTRHQGKSSVLEKGSQEAVSVSTETSYTNNVQEIATDIGIMRME